MITGALLIAIVWLFEMPLWVSISMTVVGGIKIIYDFVKLSYKIGNALQRD